MGLLMDIVLVAILVLNIIIGYKKGLINVIFNICAFLLAIVITIILYKPVSNIIIENTTIDAKDAFWDSEDITCINCKITGDFLAWYCNGLTLINCEIISSQPLCYINNLRVVDCKMEKCDLAFEYSNVNAKIKGNIISIKNPKSGEIIADSINEIIVGGNSVYESNAKIIDLSKTNK